jgi:hypothetical protein
MNWISFADPTNWTYVPQKITPTASCDFMKKYWISFADPFVGTYVPQKNNPNS